ncbi:MAG: hypothetical protein M1816_004870 [Peltula sp. TS41687]|nr:MAG: hypothetical protein M1816_004870 [Peltula sp. TS41687]
MATMTSIPPTPAFGFAGPSQPRDIPVHIGRPQPAAGPQRPSSLSISTSLPANNSIRRPAPNGYVTLHTSSVNENGSFDFDRVIKCGTVHKRTRKTKAWKKVYLVLRPDLLSLYKNEQEVRLRQQINLADLTAVAYLKDPKRDHVFGLFTPSKNYHLEAPSEKEALEWVELIRREARIEEEEAEMRLASPEGSKGAYRGFERQRDAVQLHHQQQQQQRQEDRLGSSSSEPGGAGPVRGMSTTTTRDGIRIPPVEPRLANAVDFSGNEIGSYSDFSDAVGSVGLRDSSLSLSLSDPRELSETANVAGNGEQRRASADVLPGRPAQPLSRVDSNQENERVMWHGYLYCLKTKGGVRQWKKLWAVLRPKKLAFYKSDEEYSATLLIPLSSIINAVEIDPISKNKAYCMQIIAEDKSFRFCAPDEENLARWLGALKSLLAKRKERERQRLEGSGGDVGSR